MISKKSGKKELVVRILCLLRGKHFVLIYTLGERLLYINLILHVGM